MTKIEYPDITDNRPIKSKDFPEKVFDALRRSGKIIVPLNGLSITKLQKEGRLLQTSWHNLYPKFEALEARIGEVAIDPEHLFLFGSDRKTQDERLAIIAEYSQKIARKYPGAKAIMGSYPDYVDLAYTEANNTLFMFGEADGWGYAATTTSHPTDFSRVIAVGGFIERLCVDGWGKDQRVPNLKVYPLIVPA